QDELYARMNGLLEGLKGTTDATQATMEKHMGVLLKAAVGEAAEVAEESGTEDDARSPKFNPMQFEKRVLDRAREVAEATHSPFEFDPQQPALRPEDESRISSLRTYLDDTSDARNALEVLKELSPWAVQVLAGFADDEI